MPREGEVYSARDRSTIPRPGRTPTPGPPSSRSLAIHSSSNVQQPDRLPADAPDAPLAPRTRRLAILLIVIVALAIRLLAIAGGRYGAADDTPAFFWEAEALLEGDLAGWFYLNKKPPLFALLIAGPTALGLGLVASAQLVALLAGMWMLHPAWLILRRPGDDRIAVAGLGFVAVFTLAVSLSARQLSDTTYAAILLYAIHLLMVGLLERRIVPLAGAGVLTGLAFLTRTEGVLLAVAGSMLLLLGGIVRRLAWRFVGAGALAILIPTLLLVAPYVALVSRAEGRFTLRRNMGQYMAHSVGAEAESHPPPGRRDVSLGQVLARNSAQIAAAWPGHVTQYFLEEIPGAVSYVGIPFMLIGLFVHRRRLVAWGPWMLGGLIFLLLVAMYAVVMPNDRFLSGVIVLTAWPAGAGAVAVAGWIVRWNPARMERPSRVLPWMVAAMIAATAAVTLGKMFRGPRNTLDPLSFPRPPYQVYHSDQ